jgi:inhibitor of cysteine peptidase
MPTITVDQNSSGQQIDVNVGDSVVVVLPENPTTGFLWAIRTDLLPVAELRSDTFDPVAGEMFGAPGVRRITFDATQAGQATLRLENRQEWEPNAAAADTFSITVAARI